MSPEAVAERTARHLAMCQELADIGMQLARAAAARAMADWAEDDAPKAEPKTTPRPAAAPKIANPGLLFARLSRTVRDCIDLETRIAAGPEATQHRGRAKTLPSALAMADPRRDVIRQSIYKITEKHPDRGPLRREAYAHLDEELTEDADRILCIQELLCNVCDELNLDINWGVVPDEMVGMGIEDPEPPDISPWDNHDWWKPTDEKATGPP